ncbi:MAG: putative transcriptional regulator [halophilic archaeon J07HX64]|jgi:transcriptional regulator, ArsR family|nr:MAG: putative transcriptional regulator [halophilic archaeon J07HX64]
MDSAEFLDLLGNANRRRILRLLAQKPCYVTEISEQLGVSPKAVIDHLKKLEDAGLVENRTDDRQRKYFSISQHVSLEVTVSPYKFGTRSAYPSNNRLDINSCRQVSIELESRARRDFSRRDTSEPDDSAAGPAEASCAGGDTADDGRREEDETRVPGKGVSPAGAEPSEGGCPPARAGPTTEDEQNDPDQQSQTNEVATLARQLHEFEQLERELSLLHRWAEGRITGLRERLANRIDAAEPRFVSEVLVALAEEPHRTEQLCRRLGAPPPVVEELLELLASEGVVRREKRRWRLCE